MTIVTIGDAPQEVRAKVEQSFYFELLLFSLHIWFLSLFRMSSNTDVIKRFAE